MELGTTIMGLAAIALFVLPVVAMNKSRKNKEKELLEGLKTLATSNNSDIHSFDFGMEFAIGLSQSKRQVFFHKRGKAKIVEQCISLEKVQKCFSDFTKRRIRTKNGVESVIEKIELVMISNEKDNEIIRLGFFNSEEYSQMNGEIELVEKWQAVINGCLEAKSLKI